MLNSGTSPAIGWKLSCQELIAPGAGAGRDGREQAADGRAEADLLALHVADAGLVDAGREQRVADELDVHRDDAPTTQDRRPSRAKIVQPWRWLPAYRPNV